ncbi:histidine phosphatase family protein [Streptacidiphilus sp. MAP5-3]|uniref:SixA phosphatase family protein n=1 Tax=unclassified Streptacidiphilus TaxID=2643834 RepID=UPI003513C917
MSPAPRHLIVLRHAKSAWPDGVADLDRPLGPRGRRDAPRIGAWLRATGHLPELVFCSPAHRTRETLELVTTGLGGRPEVRVEPRLYSADADGLLAVARSAPAHCATLMLVGHQPAVQELVLELIGDRPDEHPAAALLREKFPTGAAAVLEVTDPWSGLGRTGARLEAFVRPRDLP